MARVRLATIAVGLCGALGAVAPSLAAAGSISGTVIAASGGAPIQGVEVCPRPQPYAFEAACTETNASGGYKLDGLPASSYYLRFYTGTNNLNYVSESYDDKLSFFGDLLTIGASEERTGVDAQLEKGGVITGTATDADSSGPAAGVGVCASSFSPVEYSRCALTGPDGKYEINALPTGEYAVEFAGENTVNYLRQYYEVAGPPGPTRVPLAAGGAVTGIDVTLHPGAQLFGRVTEAGTGAPLEDVEVCLFDFLHAPSPEYVDRCAVTDAAGNYAMRSLRDGSFKVVFSQEPGGFESILDEFFFEQWWNGVSSASEATPVLLTPPQSVTGIDAHLTNMIQRPGPKNIQVTIFPTPKPKKCKKGFRKREVKGRVRCVKRHRHSHRHRRHRLPATR